MIAREPILIVGAGIAGLTAAIALQREGFQCELVEIAEEPLGAAISIMGRAMEALGELGVLSRCREGGYDDPLGHGSGLFDIAGSSLAKSTSSRPTSTRQGVGMYRPVFSSILREEALRLGARLRVGLSVATLQQTEDAVEAVLTDGSTGRFQLVIGADGIRSKVRALVWGAGIQPAYTGQCNIRWMTAGQPITSGPALTYQAPFGKLLGYPLPAQNLIYAITVFAAEHPDRVDSDAARALLDQQLSLFTAPYVVELHRRLTDDTPLICRPFESLLVPAPWYRGRVVLIGDAAHATTAHMSAGGGMAIEDAMVLAQSLARSNELAEGLERFGVRRFERVRIVVETSETLSRLEADGVDLLTLMARSAPAHAALEAAY